MSTVTKPATLPGVWNAHGYQGDSWSETFRWTRDGTPVDLTGAVATSAARSSMDELVQLSVVIDADPTTGIFTVQAPSGGLAADRYAYDIQFDQAGVITTVIGGTLHIEPDVTT